MYTLDNVSLIISYLGVTRTETNHISFTKRGRHTERRQHQNVRENKISTDISNQGLYIVIKKLMSSCNNNRLEVVVILMSV